MNKTETMTWKEKFARSPVAETLSSIWTYRGILYASTKVELQKKYSGSFLGSAWICIYPFLFLCVYLFVYLGVFSVSYPHLNVYESVIYIFSGLLPYIVLMETITTCSQVLKQNIHIVKNVMFPVELIPVRVFYMALISQFIGFILIFILCLLGRSFSWHIFYLPLALLFQALFLLGSAYIIAPLGLIFLDLTHILPLILNLFMFISPIGFMASILPNKLGFIVYYNPVYYYIETFRYAFLANSKVDFHVIIIAAVMSIVTFVIGCLFYYRFKDFLADYE